MPTSKVSELSVCCVSPATARRFSFLNFIACADALTLCFFAAPSSSVFAPNDRIGIDTVLLTTADVRIMVGFLLLASGIGLLRGKPWGRTIAIGYVVLMLAFLTISLVLHFIPPGAAAWYAIFPIALWIGMNQPSEESDSPDVEMTRFQFRLRHLVVGVTLFCVLFSQIGWWLNHPVDRELLKLNFGGEDARKDAMRKLEAQGAAAEKAVPTLIRDLNKRFSVEAARALVRIGTVPGLIAVVDAETATVERGRLIYGRQAVEALGQLGPQSIDAIPLLIKMLESPKVNAFFRQNYVVAALGEIGPNARVAIPAIVDYYEEIQTSLPYVNRDVFVRAFRQIGLEQLKGHTTIKSLKIRSRGTMQIFGRNVLSVKFTDTEAVGLRGLTQLEELWLTGGAITDAGLENLQGLRNLKTLHLGNTRITDAGLQYLAGLTNLVSLDLSRTKISASELMQLQDLINLRRLSLTGNGITYAELPELQQALPKCRISH